MIADPAKLGKMMHLVAQNHLLNKKHFKHKDYVQEVADTRMQELVKEGIKNAVTQAAILQLSAQLGEGTTVSPAAQDLCRIADDARYSDLDLKHMEKARLLSRSDEPHERALGKGTQTALHTLNRCLEEGGIGAPGYEVGNFNAKGAITRALNAFLGPNSPLAKPGHFNQVGQLQTNAHPNAQNPYTFASQEFLRHRLFADFESTLAQGKAAASQTGPIAKMKALTGYATTDMATKAMVARLRRLNVAAVGSILHQIHPFDYDRHITMKDLHQKALDILSSTHSASGTLDTDEKAALDRAKVKIAYHLMRHLADEAHLRIQPTPNKKGLLTTAQQQKSNQINAAKDDRIKKAASLLSRYRKAAGTGDPQKIINLAANLGTKKTP